VNILVADVDGASGRCGRHSLRHALQVDMPATERVLNRQVEGLLVVLIYDQIALIVIDIGTFVSRVTIEFLRLQFRDRFLQLGAIARESAVRAGKRNHQAHVRVGQRTADHLGCDFLSLHQVACAEMQVVEQEDDVTRLRR
jgi:hypothetical protein